MERLELAIASWAFCHFLEAKLKWKTQGFYCNFPPHIYIIMGFVLVYSPHSRTEYLLIISLRSAANMGWRNENKWALCIEDDCWRQHQAYKKVPHNWQGPLSEKSREKALRIKTLPFFLQFLLHGSVVLLLMDWEAYGAFWGSAPLGNHNRNNGSPC